MSVLKNLGNDMVLASIVKKVNFGEVSVFIYTVVFSSYQFYLSGTLKCNGSSGTLLIVSADNSSTGTIKIDCFILKSTC
uniref:Uncharacterized protein n=1 Tax=Candidatus Kentrum sp. DK TaxID=2126562 RepID=A0A450RVW8_9GAMM|nr:MAG: hypothetical protein BECKDK2373C_GA0170839_100520 [Candidatus Kentron sp. DK]